jgi:pSer/pThr/pTyr-binding forkhead associated (FHA) protein
MIRLTISRESDRLVYEFDQDEILIGRAPPADVLLDSDGVSRRHTRLQKRPEGWRISDLGAANGVFLQRKGIPPAHRVIVEPIEHGDVICIERYRIHFEMLAGAHASKQGLVEGQETEMESGEFRRPTMLMQLRVKPRELTQPTQPEPTTSGQDRLDASIALSTGTPIAHRTREIPAGTPHLEIYEGSATTPKRIPLSAAPVQFGSDPSCDVKMAGLTIPRFLACVQLDGGKAMLRRLSTGILGPKVSVDGESVKSVELTDGQKFFVGDVTCVIRLNRR